MKTNLKQLREKAGLTQPQLAALAEVSQQTISKIEREDVDSPMHETMVRLGNALGVSLEELSPGK